MPTFVRSVIIDAPIEAVFAFHQHPDALRLLSPPFPPVRIVKTTGGIEAGARVEIRTLFLHWEALHIAFEKDELFVDRQVQGPFEHWEHRHEFEDLGDITRLTDRVTYTLPGGPAANFAFGWLVNFLLVLLFRYRHRVTRRLCERAAGNL